MGERTDGLDCAKIFGKKLLEASRDGKPQCLSKTCFGAMRHPQKWPAVQPRARASGQKGTGRPVTLATYFKAEEPP